MFLGASPMAGFNVQVEGQHRSILFLAVVITAVVPLVKFRLLSSPDFPLGGTRALRVRRLREGFFQLLFQGLVFQEELMVLQGKLGE